MERLKRLHFLAIAGVYFWTAIAGVFKNQFESINDNVDLAGVVIRAYQKVHCAIYINEGLKMPCANPAR